MNEVMRVVLFWVKIFLELVGFCTSCCKLIFIVFYIFVWINPHNLFRICVCKLLIKFWFILCLYVRLHLRSTSYSNISLLIFNVSSRQLHKIHKCFPLIFFALNFSFFKAFASKISYFECWQYFSIKSYNFEEICASIANRWYF